jgi:hypothetical protein
MAAWGIGLKNMMTILLKGASVMKTGKMGSWGPHGSLQSIEEAQEGWVQRGDGEVLGSTTVVGKSGREVTRVCYI